MRNIFHTLLKSKNPNSKRYRREMAQRLDGRALKCVLEKKSDGIEEVIGHDGSLVVRGDEFLVYASMNIVLRTKIEDLSAWELLSLEGVVITAPDLEHDGQERSLVAYYKYWRKLED